MVAAPCGGILAFNEKAAELRGSPAPLLGRNLFELLPPALAHVRRQRFLEAAESGRQVRYEDEHEGTGLTWTASSTRATCGGRTAPSS